MQPEDNSAVENPRASIQPIYLPLSFEGLEKDLLGHWPVVFRHYILFLGDTFRTTAFYAFNMNSYELKKGTLEGKIEEEYHELLPSSAYVTGNNMLICTRKALDNGKGTRIQFLWLTINEDLDEETLSIKFESLKDSHPDLRDPYFFHFLDENSLYVLSSETCLWKFDLGREFLFLKGA